MKVLWFTNTPASADILIDKNVTGGGWIKTLEMAVAEQIQLSVAFYHSDYLEPFKNGNTMYYPILSKRNNLLGKIGYKLFRKVEPLADVQSFLKIIQLVKPDLIHVHGTEGPFGLIQHYTTIPVVVSIQGIIYECVKHYYDGISFDVVRKNESFKKKLFRNSYNDQFIRLKKQAKRESEILKLSRIVLGRTDWDKELTRKMTQDAIYFHVDELLRPSFYNYAWLPELTNSPQFFSTSGTNLFKGIETLIRTAYYLDKHSIQYKWLVAGISISDQIVKLALDALQLPLSENIHFLGKVEENKLAELLSQSSIYVGISHLENSPNSLCEAQLIGLPCISTNVGGTSSLITHNIDGILVPAGDSKAIADNIEKLLNSPEIAEYIGKNAHKTAHIRHNTDTVVNQLMEAYTSAIPILQTSNKTK